jgi:small-conductance mechanosensitive channel
MSPSKRLKPVQQVAASRERNAARTMGQARQHLAQEEAKLAQLRQYHQEYLQRFAQVASQGMSANQLQEYRAFLAKLDEAVRQQEKVVAASMPITAHTRTTGSRNTPVPRPSARWWNVTERTKSGLRTARSKRKTTNVTIVRSDLLGWLQGSESF